MKQDRARGRGWLLMFAAVTALCVGRAAVGQSQNSFRLSQPEAGERVGDDGNRTASSFDVWPAGITFARLSEVGQGKGIVFSPDLSVPTNRRFYERLGFTYFEDASWGVVLRQIQAHNRLYPTNKIKTLVIESHGTNGNGLKLQDGHEPLARRSYIAVGALQERLEGSGIRLCVITACNAGRLFRPQIYRALDRHTRDPLFLPATLGFTDASPRFRAERSNVQVIYPAKSELETINYGDTGEFAAETRAVLGLEANGLLETRNQNGLNFVVSDILIQMLLHDPGLRLKVGGYVTDISHANFSNEESEDLYQKFLAFINRIALAERDDPAGAASPAR